MNALMTDGSAASNGYTGSSTSASGYQSKMLRYGELLEQCLDRTAKMQLITDCCQSYSQNFGVFSSAAAKES